MTDDRPPLTAQDLQEAEAILVMALNDVAINTSGSLAGGTLQPLSADTLWGLRESQVAFGNPTDNLIRLTPELFTAMQVELSEIRKQQMASQFDFYYMTVNLTLQPARGAQFTRAGVATPERMVGLDLPANVKAQVDNKNSMKAFIVLPDYAFDLGRSEIAATGEGNSHCFWRIESPDLQQKQTVQLGIVFKSAQRHHQHHP